MSSKVRIQTFFLTAGLAMIFVFPFSCTYDNEEELFPDPGPSCVITGLTFTKDVQPIIQGNCFPCHNQATREGGINLDGFNNVTKYTSNGLLLGAIKHSPGFSPMPKSASKLSDCNISKIEEWIKNGTPQ